jgi:hypothetical protein
MALASWANLANLAKNLKEAGGTKVSDMVEDKHRTSSAFFGLNPQTEFFWVSFIPLSTDMRTSDKLALYDNLFEFSSCSRARVTSCDIFRRVSSGSLFTNRARVTSWDCVMMGQSGADLQRTRFDKVSMRTMRRVLQEDNLHGKQRRCDVYRPTGALGRRRM